MKALAAVLAAVVLFSACSDGGGGGMESFCDGSRSLRNALTKLAVGPGTAKEARRASRNARRVAEAADQMRGAAPDNVSDEVDALAEVSIALAQRLQDHYEAVAEDPSRADDAEFLSGFQISDEEERSYRRAAAKVQPVIDKRCGVRARPPATTASTQVPQGQ